MYTCNIHTQLYMNCVELKLFTLLSIVHCVSLLCGSCDHSVLIM